MFMSYSDIATGPVLRTSSTVADYFGTHYVVGRAILLAAHDAHAKGLVGLPCPEHIGTRDAVDLVKDAWHDGIVSRKLIVSVISGERSCGECGACTEADEKCPGCGAPHTKQYQSITLEVSAPFADIWADWDQSIDGSSWETSSDMPDFAYACTFDHPGLIVELTKDGYRLDLSQYEGEVGE